MAPRPLVSQADREAYDSQGFLILRDVIAPSELPDLVAAADRYRKTCLTSNKAKLGERRLNLASADMEEACEAALVNVLARPRILALSEELARGPLRSNGYFMNISESGEETTMAWHQDEKFLPQDLEAGFDVRAFTRVIPFSQIQWNLPLLDDAALWIVPGSQLRDPTAGEKSAMAKEAFDPGLPGALRVELNAGDAVVYHNNLIHGLSDSFKRKRRTLHWYWVKKGARDPYDLSRVTIPAVIRSTLHPDLQALI